METDDYDEHDEHACVICFEENTCNNPTHNIDYFIISPDCECSYSVHSYCIQRWFETHDCRCIYCNSPAKLNYSCCDWVTFQTYQHRRTISVTIFYLALLCLVMIILPFFK
jgi:hypothetical protein